ncbi:MAG: hypothetical protein IKT08_05025 [Bacteroidales bacterium]|nr:hypothetical protein [Bacteroidales bacterium]
MEHKYSQAESETPKVSEPVIPRVCSIEEAQLNSMTFDQFTGKLYAMVDAFYSTRDSQNH